MRRSLDLIPPTTADAGPLIGLALDQIDHRRTRRLVPGTCHAAIAALVGQGRGATVGALLAAIDAAEDKRLPHRHARRVGRRALLRALRALDVAEFRETAA